MLAGALVASFLFCAVAWFVGVSGYWNVQNVEMNDLRISNRGEVVSAVFDILDQGSKRPWGSRNILFLNARDTAERLREQIFAEVVLVDKVYPNILRLKIIERQRSVVVVAKSMVHTVDMSGIVVGQASDAIKQDAEARIEGKYYATVSAPPVILVDSIDAMATGTQITNEIRMREWIEAYRRLMASDVKFKAFKLTEPMGNTMRIALATNYDMIVSLADPLEPQLDTYKRFIQNVPKNVDIREYVDVRVPGKIYVK